jgi:hypothetical protein
MTDPLLSEFDPNHTFGWSLRKLPLLKFLLDSETHVRGSRLAWTFFWVALATSILSVLCNAGRLQATLINTENPATPPSPYILSFGYLYEMNAAFWYLFLAPIFVFLGVRFVSSAHFALNGLSLKKRLITNYRYKNQRLLNKDPLVTLGRMNRRFFRPAFLILIVGATAVVVVGTEFLPPPELWGHHKGDYWGLAFGYIQSKALPRYENKTLQQLVEEGRDVKNIPAIAAGDNWRQKWRVVPTTTGGTTTRSEYLLFWPFVVFALGVQVLFIPFAIWIFFKAIFVLRCVYNATTPSERSPLELKLDYEDADHAFGLADLHQAYNYLVAIIFVGAAGMASVVISNVPKGSHRTLSGEGTWSIFGSIGQLVTTFIPFILFLVLIVFLFFLHMKTEEQRQKFVSSLDAQIAKLRKPNPQLDAKRDRACKQTAWPDAIFKTWFGASVSSYIVPVTFLKSNPGWTETIYNLWVRIADLFAGAVEPIHRWIK